MKKVIILSTAVVAFSVTANAQANGANDEKETAGANIITQVGYNTPSRANKHLTKSSDDEVSFFSKRSFFEDFGDADEITWVKTKSFDEVSFFDGKQYKTAYYDADSKLVGTTMAKTFDDLPAKAQKVINDKYKDYNVAGITFFDDNEDNETDMVLFGLRFEDADNYFIELTKDSKKVILQVSLGGDMRTFKEEN
jgi:hypothetical protein